MKTKLLFLTFWLLSFTIGKSFAQEIQVSSFSYFTELIGSCQQQVISLSSNIISSCDYYPVGTHTKIIEGNHLTLNGIHQHMGFFIKDTTVNIANLTMQNFHSNVYGRVLFLDGSTLEGRGSITFANNIVDGIIKDGPLLSTLKNALGGVIHIVKESSINFINANIRFIDNNANGKSCTRGGAIFIENKSRMNFINSKIIFTNNKSLNGLFNYGGAISVNNQSAINFNDSNVVFELNVSDYGDAIHGARDSIINFRNSNITLKNNGKITYIPKKHKLIIYIETQSAINNHQSTIYV
jgi:hypothetical protein